MIYFVKTPGWLKKLYSNCTWHMPADEKIIYLTFDDGPHLMATPFILDTLRSYDAKGTFFCIGKNVVELPDLYERIIGEGHATGNHTFNHLNGWKTSDELYLQNVAAAQKYINTNLFRPPYGRARRSQLKRLAGPEYQLRPIMWTILSGDFDPKLSAEKCLQNVTMNAGNGSIVLFHDSQKAFEKVVYALPRVLEYFKTRGYRFEKIVL